MRRERTGDLFHLEATGAINSYSVPVTAVQPGSGFQLSSLEKLI